MYGFCGERGGGGEGVSFLFCLSVCCCCFCLFCFFGGGGVVVVALFVFGGIQVKSILPGIILCRSHLKVRVCHCSEVGRNIDQDYKGTVHERLKMSGSPPPLFLPLSLSNKQK